MRIYYRWRLHTRHLSMKIDSLVNIWRNKTFLEKLPDHFTAMLQLAKGLEYIHSQKLIHGDIKPENVLIFEKYSGKAITLKWAYFGSLMRPLSEKKTINRKLTIIEKREIEEKYYGSTESRKWLAPELQGESNPLLLATFESDVFAEGLVFGWLLLDGVHPFEDQDEEITSKMKMDNPVNFESKLY
jgi:serine/threonine protein kinase